MAAGPLSSYLTNRYGERSITILGGLLGSTGVVLSSFATNVYYLCITFGLLTGAQGLFNISLLNV
jgi:MFS family permease